MMKFKKSLSTVINKGKSVLCVTYEKEDCLGKRLIMEANQFLRIILSLGRRLTGNCKNEWKDGVLTFFMCLLNPQMLINR